MYIVNPSQINFYDDTVDHNQFISQLSTSPSSTETSITAATTSKMVQEQFRQSQECLETSAAYMKEIDSFFRELSMQRSTTSTSNSTPIASTLSFDSFDFDLNKTLMADENMDGGAIDPAVIFNIDHMDHRYSDIEGIISDYADEEDYDELFENEQTGHLNDPVQRHSSRFSAQLPQEQFGLLRFQRKPPTVKRSSTSTTPQQHQQRPRKQIKHKLHTSSVSSTTDSFSASSFSSPKSGSSNSASASSSKAPKFYSRSGQIADPNRGPCHNCNTTLTCYWRKLAGLYYCNACTLFYKRNNMHRDVKEITVDKPIKRRNRKSKYAEM